MTNAIGILACLALVYVVLTDEKNNWIFGLYIYFILTSIYIYSLNFELFSIVIMLASSVLILSYYLTSKLISKYSTESKVFEKRSIRNTLGIFLVFLLAGVVFVLAQSSLNSGDIGPGGMILSESEILDLLYKDRGVFVNIMLLCLFIFNANIILLRIKND